MIFFVPCQIPLRWDVNIILRVALSKKAGSSRSEASWMKGSITQPDFKRLFADAVVSVRSYCRYHVQRCSVKVSQQLFKPASNRFFF